MRKIITLSLLPIAALLFLVAAYLKGGRYQDTENAYVQAGIATVSSSAAGYIQTVHVNEYDQVDAGTALFSLDPRDFQIAEQGAQERLKQAHIEIQEIKAQHLLSQAKLSRLQKQRRYAKQELERVAILAKHDRVSKEHLAAKQHELTISGAEIDIAQAQLKTTLAKLDGNASKPDADFSVIRAAKNQLEQARLNLDRSVIYARVSGSVAQHQLHPGEYIQAGEAAMSLVQNQQLWIEANFKETQLTHMRLGQTAVITIDAFPELKIQAKIHRIAPASGAEFAILPPQNATGNWVKITQRIPVRLHFDQSQIDQKIVAGMTVNVEVDTMHERTLSNVFK